MSMSRYVLLHGSGGVDMWIPWLQKELEKKSEHVWVPLLPDPQIPNLQKQLPFLLQSGKLTSDTTIIGHSAACPLILSALEKIQKPIKKTILVSGYVKPLEKGSSPDPILQDTYDLEKIKSSSNEFVWVVSDNDPWGCGEEMNRPLFDSIGGTFVVVHNGGHFGSNTFKAPLYEFPLLLSLV